jgi:RNA polymerase sigma-70 factor (ECF subfamily)
VTARPATNEQWRRLRSDLGRLLGRRLPTATDVEDVVQEVLLRVWRRGDDLRDGERFGAWLSRIAYTAAADHMRARQRHPVPRHPSGPEGEAPDAGGLPDQPEARDLITAVLRPFVESLPEPYREAVALSELEGLSHAKIAERLGLSVSGVKSRVQRGREQVRIMLDRCCVIALDARGAPVSCEVRGDGQAPADCCGEISRGGCAPGSGAEASQQPATTSYRRAH